MTNPSPIESLLSRIPLFESAGPERIRVLATSAQRRRYARGSTILAAGERAKGIHVLLAGTAKVVIADANAHTMTVSVIDTNDFFGATGDGEGLQTGASVEALEVCEILYVPASAFAACTQGNYAVAMLLLRSAEARLCKAQHKIASLGLVDVYGRVARLLVESAREVEGRWLVETGAEEIARTVAASREMVSRVVKSMRTQGLVRKDKRSTVILDLQSMVAACSA